VELAVRPDDNPGSLNGSGMLIIGPPWGLEEDLPALLEEAWQALRQDGAPPPRLAWLRDPV